MGQFDDLWQQAELNRRELIGAGFALSTQPVQAQTMIVTDPAGLEAGMVGIPTANGTIPAYRAALGAQTKSRIEVYPDAPHAFFTTAPPTAGRCEGRLGEAARLVQGQRRRVRHKYLTCLARTPLSRS